MSLSKTKFSSMALFLFGLLLCSNIGISSTGPQYVISIVILFVTLIATCYIKNQPRKKLVVMDLLPLFMILTWAYGVALGFLKGNDTVFIFSNFAGLTLYFFYYSLRNCDVSKSSLIKLLIFVAYINAIYAFIISLGTDRVVEQANDGIENLGSSRLYYSAGLLVFFPCLSLILANYFVGATSQSSQIKNLIFVGVSLICLVYFSVSKGFLAALLFLIFLYIVIFIVRNLTMKRKSVHLISLIFLLVVSSIYIATTTSIFDKLLYLFSSEEVSNSVRSEQREYLMNEFSFLGEGLGAVLKSGYNRGDEAAYGFELSYENLIHKIGVFSVCPFLVYIYTLFRAFYQVLKRINLEYSACALGAMVYLIPAYGNPMLFSPLAVMLHCIALYLLRNDNLIKHRNAFNV